jgi:hypothetical protein
MDRGAVSAGISVALWFITSSGVWFLLGKEARCKDAVEQIQNPASCEKVTVLGISPVLSEGQAGLISLFVAGALVVFNVVLLDRPGS